MQKNFKAFAILLALALTGAHFVRASDVKLRFSEDGYPRSEYVMIAKLDGKPLRFSFSRCVGQGGRGCSRFGRAGGYTLEEIRTPYLRLDALRGERGLTRTEARSFETLALLIDGIERPPYRRNPNTVYSWTIKGSASQFARVVEARL
jgi:hypothetical protein